MTHLATGIDLIEIGRIESALQQHGERFLQRIYTPVELAEWNAGFNRSAASLAARFTAKEAAAKALGTGIGLVSWQDIEILHTSLGQPILHLHGAAASLATQLGLTSWSLSLSHTHTYAIAMVVAIS